MRLEAGLSNAKVIVVKMDASTLKYLLTDIKSPELWKINKRLCHDVEESSV